MLTIHRFKPLLSAALGVALLLVHAWVLAETDTPERIEWKKAPIRLELTVGEEQRIEFPSAVKVGVPLREDPEALAEEDEDEDADEEGGGRDVLGEMEIAARIMITGGDEREDARLTRADRLLVRNAIFLAAKTVKESDREQVLTEDVVAALQRIGQDASLPDHRRNRAIEMSDGMALFCSGLAGHFFNAMVSHLHQCGSVRQHGQISFERTWLSLQGLTFSLWKYSRCVG